MRHLFLVLWQRNIRHLREFAAMKDEDRRQMLRSLTDGEYRNIVAVAGSLPYVEMTIRSEGRQNTALHKSCCPLASPVVLSQRNQK